MTNATTSGTTTPRPRTHTLDSVASWGSGGGLRERANTAGSVRSRNDSQDALSFPEPLGSPLRTGSGGHTTTSTRRISFGMSPPSAARPVRYPQLRQTVEWIQRQRVPVPVYRQGRRLWTRIVAMMGASFSNNTSSTTTNKPPKEYVPLVVIDEDNAVYWVEGLDRVVFGTSSAAEVMRIAGIQPPRYLWYMISGACCDVIQLCMDVTLSNTLIDDASVCWAVTFFASVFFRHSFHRYLVFGDYVGGYRASLLRMYGGYSIIIVISTVFNLVMTRVATLSHYMAWIITLLWTGIVNYFILKKLWSFGGTTTTGTTTTTAGTTK